MIANWKVWPILQFLNFSFVPLNMQAAYVAFFSLFFNVYLSFMKFVVKRPDEMVDAADAVANQVVTTYECQTNIITTSTESKTSSSSASN